MGLGILLVDEVDVVRAYELDAILMSQFYQHLVGSLLQREGLTVGALGGVLHLVALQLQVVVVAKHVVVPLDSLAGARHVAVEDLLGHFAGNAGRTDHQSLVVSLQVFAVGTWTHVVAVHPCVRHELDEVLVALVVLGQHDEVVAALVFLAPSQRLRTVTRDIHLAAEDGDERFQPLFLPLLVDVDAVVVELLDPEHVAVVGDGHALHAVGYRLVNEL